ncbi:hypothetical protein KGQ20_33115 [Catenulispora sp. NF23]|uniref:DUF6234 domain-containing protein n=1 Tax=Catenulispora pinistramenti TaxID=2705254 RepID=A0ABS5L551_9ACTN|nr:DUF6234 family protein [Catenulispora pinistramenti]MBS2537603.1 hypothetical protein [Catenulispora pinistramenti]MBS2553468.1 hypothetical protein [Catenulispora pinistramenti]
MSSLASGSSVSRRVSGTRRFLAVIAVDSVCFVTLVWGAFIDGMHQGWMSRTPTRPTHYLSWALLLVGATLVIHAGYALRRSWFPEVGSQAIAAVVMTAIGFTLLSSPDESFDQPQPQPARNTYTNSGTFCDSGGSCYVNGVQVSGYP